MHKQKEIVKNSKKTINAWCSYDIANSSYNLSISTVLYPIYYEQVTKDTFQSDFINFWGISFKNTVLYEYSVAMGYLAIIILTLLLSGIADIGNYRKRFMKFFTFLGAFSCMGLFLFKGQNIGLGLTLSALAVMGFAGSLVYYNSFLPLIATPDQYDKISARGFSFGYAGSMLLLIFNLISIENYTSFGFEGKLQAIRFSFLEVGIWWLVVSQIAFYFLKEQPKKVKVSYQLLMSGFNEVISVFKKIKQDRDTFIFLSSFFFFSMGVQTIIIVASLFGSSELGISGSKLIVTILIIQVVAILGSFLFGFISSKFGNKVSLMTMLFIWTGICLAAFIVKNTIHFFTLAGFVGLVMGGIQSQSRSTYSKLIPTDSSDTASYFSFYDSTEKLAIVLGMFGFALLEHLTGNMRNSAVLLSIFFLISMAILAFAKLKKE